jgi:hypothetical protein
VFITTSTGERRDQMAIIIVVQTVLLVVAVEVVMTKIEEKTIWRMGLPIH